MGKLFGAIRGALAGKKTAFVGAAAVTVFILEAVGTLPPGASEQANNLLGPTGLLTIAAKINRHSS